MAQHVSGDTPPIIRRAKTVIAASGFTYVFGCRLLRWLSHRSGRQPKTYVKPEAAITVFALLMMGGVSPETCWAIKKHWNNKFYYTFASCWFFLWDIYYAARIHEHQVWKFLFIFPPIFPSKRSCSLQYYHRLTFQTQMFSLSKKKNFRLHYFYY